MAKSKMTMKKWEKSSADKKADASGRFGKEGSKREQAHDRREIAKINKKRGF